MTPNYLTIEELIELIEEPNRAICHSILRDSRDLFERAPGSTYNHQTWEGGYLDHVVDGMNYARHLYSFDASFGRPIPFTVSDVMLIFFLHDLEKPWRIVVDSERKVSNREGFNTKEDYKKFRESKLAEYGLQLTAYQLNALTFVEGEGQYYQSTRRVMNELAAFCHRVDCKSAREWYDYPRAEGDEWLGAKRYRK